MKKPSDELKEMVGTFEHGGEILAALAEIEPAYVVETIWSLRARANQAKAEACRASRKAVGQAMYADIFRSAEVDNLMYERLALFLARLHNTAENLDDDGE